MASGLHKIPAMTARTTLLRVTLLLALLATAQAQAAPFSLASLKERFSPARREARARSGLIRSGIQIHHQLRSSSTPVSLAKSAILSDAVASTKTYGDSWTCRSSTQLLIGQLGQQGQRLKLDSVGKNAFDWGKEGKVSYHYFGVDSTSRPTVLLDPTAYTNFSRDAQPGGLLHGFLERAGQQLGQPRAAQRVARRIAKGSFDGLLVLANPAEIAVYRQALDDAARMQAQVRRNRERAPAATFRLSN